MAAMLWGDVLSQYHPITGQPVFLRMVIEDEDGRALKFRTRTKDEYARVRPGMVAEAVLVSMLRVIAR